MWLWASVDMDVSGFNLAILGGIVSELVARQVGAHIEWIN